jgi:hypothetical protein
MVERKRTPLYKRYERLIRKVFKGQMQAVAERIRQMPLPEMALAAGVNAVDTPENTALWNDAFRKLNEQTVTIFADAQYRELANEKGFTPFWQTKADDAPPPNVTSMWQEEVNNYLDQDGAAKVVGIQATTQAAVQAQLIEGVAAGEGIEKLARRISGTNFADINRKRARVIARTEVIGASNRGQMAGARSLGVPLEKEWVATVDSVTRDTHAAADGQTVPLNEPFIVGTSRMMQPGDDSAPPSEIINCRCTVSFARVTDSAEAIARPVTRPTATPTVAPSPTSVQAFDSLTDPEYYGDSNPFQADPKSIRGKHKKWAKNLSDADWGAVRDWIQEDTGVSGRFNSGKITAADRHLVDIFKSAPTTNRTVYRGLHSNTPRSNADLLEDWSRNVGTRQKWAAPQSTSFDPEVAAKYADLLESGAKSKNTVIMEYVDTRTHFIEGSTSLREFESIVLPDQQFEVIAARIESVLSGASGMAEEKVVVTMRAIK